MEVDGAYELDIFGLPACPGCLCAAPKDRARKNNRRSSLPVTTAINQYLWRVETGNDTVIDNGFVGVVKSNARSAVSFEAALQNASKLVPNTVISTGSGGGIDGAAGILGSLLGTSRASEDHHASSTK
jgi:nucleoside phosphorylase